MDLFVQRLFRDEIEMQCRLILVGKEQLDTAKSDPKGWFALQGILVSAANISKLLWGSRGKRAAKRRELRASLGIDDSSPLRSPDLRNDFEHFDERMETHFGKERNRIYAGRNVGPGIRELAPPDVAQFGHYEPSTGVVTFWGNSVSLPEIFDEVKKILAVLEDRG